MKRTRTNHSAKFKARVALEALRGDATLAHACLATRGARQSYRTWRKQLLEHAGEVFENGNPAAEDAERRIPTSRPKWVKPTMERDFLSEALGDSGSRAQSADRPRERAPDHASVRTAGAVPIGPYYRPKPPTAAHLALMRRIDELHLAHPFLGSRRLARMLKREGAQVGRQHVATLMRRMGIEAIYRKKPTTIPEKGHKIYPYLLRELAIERPNQAWASDITYLPMAKGFAYLVAIVDLYSRKVLAWRVSNAMTSEFCVEAVAEALRANGAPEIFNTDQGSQFTDEDFTAPLLEKGVRVSMDGKGRWIDNVFVKRLWRSVKYEDIVLHADATPREVKIGLARYFRFYNERRVHQSLDYRTPDEPYFETGKTKKAA